MTFVNAPHPPAIARLARLPRVARIARIVCIACAALALPACGAAEPPREAVLVADPPLGVTGNTPDDGAVQTELDRGVAYVKNEKFAEAKEHFQKAIAVKPSAGAFTYLGIVDEKTGDRPGAVAAYKSALGVDPGFVEAAQNLAAIYLDDPARPDDAIAVLKPAIAKSPAPQLLQNLAFAYGLKGDLDSASKAYEASLAKGEDAQARFAWGALLLKNKQADRAAEQFKKAVDGARDDVQILVISGQMLDEARAYGDCVRAFDRAIKIKATDPDWFVRRGRCKHSLGDEPGAQADYEAAIKVDASFAAAHLYLGVSALARNNRLKATVELEKAQKLGGDGPIGKVARQRLEALNKKK